MKNLTDKFWEYLYHNPHHKKLYNFFDAMFTKETYNPIKVLYRILYAIDKRKWGSTMYYDGGQTDPIYGGYICNTTYGGHEGTFTESHWHEMADHTEYIIKLPLIKPIHFYR